jgi:hypothetical protein
MPGELPHLERLFPRLLQSEYSKSSEPEPFYNCFAFAVHDTGQYWQKVQVRGYYWPLERDDRVEDWVRALRLNNFEVTDNWELEARLEKVAIYVNEDGTPEHVARQLESGHWTSKIGKLEDIQHSTLSALEGAEYGKATVVMQRLRVAQNRMKLPAPTVPGDTEAERMDNAVRKMFSVSKEGILKEEAKWKRARAQKKRTKKPT